MSSGFLPRIAILTASVGSGHTRAAHAAAAAIRLSQQDHGHPARCSKGGPVRVFDALEDASPAFRSIYRDGYLALVRHAPSLVGMLYDRTDRPGTGPASTLRRTLQRGALRRLAERIAAFEPDVVVSTHFLTSEWCAWMRRRGTIACPLVTVVTDLHPHAIWLHGPCEAVCVSSVSASQIVRASGQADRAEVTGIPIDPAFGQPASRAEAAATLVEAGEVQRLEPDRPRILLSTGGCCVGPVRSMWESLLSTPSEVEVVAVCGHNEQARRLLQSVVDRRNVSFRARVIGYTPRMHAWMAVSRVLVGKPGGLTSAECRARGLPMVIACAVPGQEDRNAHCMELWGCAVRAQSPEDAGPAAIGMMSDPVRLAGMAAAARSSAQPEAASAVASVIWSVHRRL